MMFLYIGWRFVRETLKFRCRLRFDVWRNVESGLLVKNEKALDI